MTSDTIFNNKLLDELIIHSIKEVYEKDIDLIYKIQKEQSYKTSKTSKHVYEVAVMFRFGYYLQTIINNDKKYSALKFYDLDLEYNRHLDDKKEAMIKKENKNKIQTIRPDLVIHKRGNNEHNLMVLEAKGWWNDDQKDDKNKIEALVSKNLIDPTKNYEYQEGYILLFTQNFKNVKIRKFTKEKLMWEDVKI